MSVALALFCSVSGLRAHLGLILAVFLSRSYIVILMSSYEHRVVCVRHPHDISRSFRMGRSTCRSNLQSIEDRVRGYIEYQSIECAWQSNNGLQHPLYGAVSVGCTI